MNQLLEEFKRRIGNDYLFHIHTTYTDGKNSIEDYIKLADKLHLHPSVFMEHIRINYSYDFRKYVNDVHWLGGIAGFEAKILPGGTLNIPEDALQCADVIGIAVHSFLEDFHCLIKSLKTAFSFYSNYKPVIFLHPALHIKERFRADLTDFLLTVLNDYQESVMVELNVKYNVIPWSIIKELLLGDFNFIVGFDAHCLEDILLNLETVIQLRKKLEGHVSFNNPKQFRKGVNL